MTAKEFSISMRVAGSGMALWRNMVDTGSSGFVYLSRWAYGTLSKITAN